MCPCAFFHADGDVTWTAQPAADAAIDGRWLSLGRYRFEQACSGSWMVSTDAANGHVIADAVQFHAG